MTSSNDSASPSATAVAIRLPKHSGAVGNNAYLLASLRPTPVEAPQAGRRVHGKHGIAHGKVRKHAVGKHRVRHVPVRKKGGSR